MGHPGWFVRRKEAGSLASLGMTAIVVMPAALLENQDDSPKGFGARAVAIKAASAKAAAVAASA